MGLFDKIKKLNVFSGFFSIDEDFFDDDDLVEDESKPAAKAD